MSYTLHHADCLQVMAGLPTGSVDCILSDPPYLTTNLHFDQAPSMDWAAWWVEAWRVLKPTGVAVLFAADLFTVDLILTQRQNYRYRLVWQKSRLSRFLDAGRRPLQGHEDILIFAEHPSKTTYNPQKVADATHKRVRLPVATKRSGHYSEFEKIQREAGGLRHPTTIVSFSSGDNNAALHPTQKPVDLMRWLVRTYTNPNDTVLDCFAGSGSTLHACLLENRVGIGCELDPDYYAKALHRLRTVASAPLLL